MAYVPNSGSVAAWLQSDTASVITVGQGSVAVAIVSGSIAASFTPPANQSVSGTVGARLDGTNASIITVAQSSVAVAIVSGSIAATFTPPANQSVSGTVDVRNNSSVISYVQNSVATVIIGGSIAATFTPPANQSVSGTVQTDVRSSVATVIIGGSIAASFTPPANQSVSGTVDIRNNSSVISYVQNSVAAVIIGGSIATATTNSSVMLLNSTNVIGSVLVLQGTNPFIITGSIQGGGAGTQYIENAITPSVTGTAVMFKSNMSSSIVSVVSPGAPLPVSVQGTVTTLQGTTPWLIGSVYGNISGSVAAIVTNTPSISGTVNVAEQGTWIVSIAGILENTIQTSTAGIPVIFRSNTNTSILSVVSPATPLPVSVQGTVNIGIIPGSTFAVQGTTPWLIGSVYGNISGSVIAVQGGGWAPSAVGYLERNDNVASYFGADLTYRPFTGDSAGRLIIKPFAADDAARLDTTSSVASGSVTLLFNSVVGLRNYVTDILIANTGSVATLVTFKDGSTSILGMTIAPAGGGSNINGMAFPLRTAPSQDFVYTAATATSVLYVTAKGYKAP